MFQRPQFAGHLGTCACSSIPVPELSLECSHPCSQRAQGGLSNRDVKCFSVMPPSLRDFWWVKCFSQGRQKTRFFAGWLITMATSTVTSPRPAALISEIRETFLLSVHIASHSAGVAVRTILKEELTGNSINQRAPQSQTSGCSSYCAV